MSCSKSVTKCDPNSTKRVGLSSGSDNLEESGSCHGESDPVISSISLRNENVDSQKLPNLIQSHDISNNETNQGNETSVVSIISSEKDLSSHDTSVGEPKNLICESPRISENNLKPESTTDDDSQYSDHGIRKTSYKKAMTVPGILLESSSFTQLEDCATMSDEALASPTFNQSLSSDSSVCGSPSILPILNPNGSNISRSVSFNDKILDTPRRTLELHKCSSVESSSCVIDPPSLESSKDSRLLQSTPGRLQIISKHPSATMSLDNESYSSSLTSVEKDKSSLKNLTSSLSRRLSFGRLKSKRKQKEENILRLNAENGILPTEQGISSYESLLRLFECPGCHAFMFSPLLQCRKGHLICEKCKTSLKATCPTCKQRITDNTNYMMEQVCQLVRFPCQFANYGCPEYHLPKLKTDHEHFCVYRPVNCHFEASGCPTVLPLKEMNLHIGSCKFKYKGKD